MATWNKSGIWCLLTIVMECFGTIAAQSPCTTAANSDGIQVARFCYQSFVSANNRLILDTFGVYGSQGSECTCQLTSSARANVSLSAYKNLQPPMFCQSSILMQAGGTASTVNCFVFGRFDLDGMALNIRFIKPTFTSYNASYCILFTSNNPLASLSLNCQASLGSTQVTPQTTTRTTTTTTIPTTTTTTTTTRTLPTTTTSTTTTLPTTTTIRTTTRMTTTTQRTTKPSTTTTPTTTRPTTTQTTTVPTRPRTTTRTNTDITSPRQPSASNQSGQSDDDNNYLIFVIPAAGGGFLIIVAIIAACVIYNRKNGTEKHDYLKPQPAAKTSYSNYAMNFEEESGKYTNGKLSVSTKSTDINAVIIDDDKDDTSVITNQSEGTFIRHSVRQTDQIPVYAAVDKSKKSNNGDDVFY